MFDDFRQQAEESEIEQLPEAEMSQKDIALRAAPKRFLGMTAVQRLVIAVMLLMMVCVSGSFFLLVTGKVVPPF